MSVTNEELEALFASDSPYLKALDNIEMRKTITIKSVGQDSYEQDDGRHDHFVFLDVGASKPIKLSKTNGRELIGALGNVSNWPGTKCLLTVKSYNIDGKNTFGWVVSPIPKDDTDPDDEIPF